MHRFETPTAPSLRVEFRAGTVRMEGQETIETLVELTGRRDDQATRDLIADTLIEQRGDVIVVHVPKQGLGLLGRTPELDLRIVAPSGSKLAVRAASADIIAQGSFAGGRAETGSGDVTVQHLTAATRLRSGSGDVRVDSAEADLDVQTGSGDIEIGSVSAAATLQTGSGDIEIAHVSGDVRAQAGSGDIKVGDAEHDVQADTASGTIRIDRVRRGEVKAQGATADIHVGVAPGTMAWLDVRTLTGRVTTDLDTSDEPAAGQEKVRIRLESVSGDVDVVRA
jgi:DUF4097 and DUF4098 domain-containing protein YvlB